MPEPLVLLPGMMCDARVWGELIAHFSRRAGVSVAPLGPGERIEEIASTLLDGLPHRFALAGLSMGGIVAMEILRRAPDRVARLALMDTNPLAETPQSAAAYEPLVVKLRSATDAAALSDAARGFFQPEFLAPGPDRMRILGLLGQMAADIGSETVIAQVRALQRRRDYQAVLRRARVPVTVLCGRHDALTPVRRHEFMAQLIPGARLSVIEEAGHLPPLEAPEQTIAALEAWLDQPLFLQTRVDE